MSIDPLLLGYRQGMATCDIEYGMWCAYFAVKQSLFSGRVLDSLEENMREYTILMSEHNQENALASLSVWWQAVLNLQGRSDSAVELSGEAMNLKSVLEEATRTKNTFLTTIVNLNRLWLAYLFGDYYLAANMAKSSRNIQDVAPGVFEVVEQAFYDGLTSCVMMKEGRQWKISAQKSMEKLQKWARACPDNCLHKYLLLKAEYIAATGRDFKAWKVYREALVAAEDSGFLQDEALTYERMGRFAIGQNDFSFASHSIARSHQLYMAWGAQAKGVLLETELPLDLKRGRADGSFRDFLDDLDGRIAGPPVMQEQAPVESRRQVRSHQHISARSFIWGNV